MKSFRGRKNANVYVKVPTDLEKLQQEFPRTEKAVVADIFESSGRDPAKAREKMANFAEEKNASLDQMDTDMDSNANSDPLIEEHLIGKLDEQLRFFCKAEQSEPSRKTEITETKHPPIEDSTSKDPQPSLEKAQKPSQSSNLPCQITTIKKKKKGAKPSPNSQINQEKPQKPGDKAEAALAQEEQIADTQLDDEQMREVRGHVLNMIKNEVKDFRLNEKEELSSVYFSELLNEDIVKVQRFIEKKFEQMNLANNFMGSQSAMDELFPSLTSSKPTPAQKQKQNPANESRKKDLGYNNSSNQTTTTRDIIKELNKPHQELQKQKLNAPYTSYVTQTAIVPVVKAESTWAHYRTNDHLISKETADNLIYLHDMFPRLNFLRLKMIFSCLDEDFENTKEFLLSEFRECYVPPAKPFEAKQSKNSSKSESFDSGNYFSAETVNLVDKVDYEELNNLIMDIRRDLEENFKLYSIYGKCASASKTSMSAANLSSFTCLMKNSIKNIEHLKEVSQYIVFRKSQETGFAKIDLHNLFLDEAIQVLYTVIDVIRQRISKRSESALMLEVITGKGRHSKNKAILYPEILKSLRENNFKVTPAEGKLMLLIQY